MNRTGEGEPDVLLKFSISNETDKWRTSWQTTERDETNREKKFLEEMFRERRKPKRERKRGE